MGIEFYVMGTALASVIFIQYMKIRKMESFQDRILGVLGYYRLRFGAVTAEEIEAGVGISKESVEEFKEKVKNEQL